MDSQINLMKFILLATIAAAVLGTATFTTATLTPGFNTGTRANATCTVKIEVAMTLGTVVDTEAQKFAVWLTTSTAVTPAALTDWEIMCSWAGVASGTSALTASTTLTATCSAINATSTTAWASSGTSLTTSGSTLATTGAFSTTITFGYDLWNYTTSKFVDSSKTLQAWGNHVSDTATNAATGTAFSTATAALSMTACNTGMAAIKSGSALANSFISTFLTFSFF